jgi:hypothetical protein
MKTNLFRKLVTYSLLIFFVIMTIFIFIQPNLQFKSKEARLFDNARPLRPENMPDPKDWKNERYFRKFDGLRGSNNNPIYIPTAPIHKGIL